MKHNSELISDDNGIEVLVGYNYETSGSHKEYCHGEHEVGLLTETILTSVEVVICGRGIDILPMLTKREKEHIVQKLNYE